MTMTAPAKQFKITYSAVNADMSEFHSQFDKALEWAKSQMGREHPLYIDDKPVKSLSQPIIDVSPIDTSTVLGKFAAASAEAIAGCAGAAD